MNYNPYSAPQAPPPPPVALQGAGTPQPWEVGEVLGAAWEAFKVNWVVLVFSYLIAIALAVIPYFAIGLPLMFVVNAPKGGAPAQNASPDPDLIGALIPAYVVVVLALAFFYVGLTRIWVAAARGETPTFNMLFSGIDRYVPFLGVVVLFVIGAYVGLLLLVVPGVILWCGWMVAPFLAVDAKAGVMDSLAASWAATSGQRGKIFLFGLLAIVLHVALQLTCCGYFVSTPLMGVAWAIVCMRVTGRGGPPVASAAGGPGGYGGPPPGYGGPPLGYGGPPAGYGGPPPGYGGPPPGYGPPPGTR
jgi:hypothetical protein